MRYRSCPAAFAVITMTCGAALAADGDGLTEPSSGWYPGRWQARVEATGHAMAAIGADPYNLAVGHPGQPWRGINLFGDYYFGARPPEAGRDAGSSGFRATSGLMTGSLSAFQPVGSSGLSVSSRPRIGGSYPLHSAAPAWLADGRQETNATLPYFGVGYTGVSGSYGWGFTADLGLVALSPRSAVRLGGVLAGPQSIDELLRELRFSPLMRLGVSYAF